MTSITIERTGGLAGFGSPGSHLKSRGAMEWQALTAAERDALERLFASDRGQSRGSVGQGDSFRYRLTISGKDGTESIEVSESEVPRTLLNSLRDEIV